MNKNLQVIGGSVLGALALMAVAVQPASAAPTDGTTATFVVAGGSLDVDTAGTATLDPSTPGTQSITGDLGEISISDTRGVTTGWVMSAASTTFTRTGGGADSTSGGVSYNSGAATASTGTVTPTSTGATSITAVAPVAAGTAASGNNTATYEPTLAVALPATALAGTYTGTVTTSLV